MALTAPFTAAAHSAGAAFRAAGQSVALYAVAGVIGLTGIGFMLAAAYIWLAGEFGPLAAALWMGIALLLIAAIMIGVLLLRQRRARQARRNAAANTALTASTLSLATTGLRLVSRVKGPMFLSAAATLLAAWYLGKSSGHGEED